MKKLFTMFFLSVLIAPNVFSQSSANYTFSTNSNGSLGSDMNSNTVDMTTGTTQLIAPGLNSVASVATAIGFEFWFMGSRNTTINVTSHGLMGLTTTIGTTNNIGGGAGPRIGAFVNGTTGTNMGTHSTGKVHYKLVGTAPNRTLVVEWLNMSISSASTNADATFQVRLYETTWAIELMYGAMNITTGGPFTTIRAGISSNTTANTFSTVNFATHATNTATGTDNTLNNAVVTQLNSAANGTRRYYRFVPSAPAAAPSGINFTAVTATAMSVNWTDNATDETGYAIYRSDDGGTTYNFQSLTAANAVTFAASALLANTTYFWRVYTIREIPGAAVQGSQLTNNTIAVTTTGSGLWSNPGTWSTGAVPTISDAVTIGTGHTISIDVAGTAYSLSIDGTLEFELLTARALAIVESVTVNAGGLFQSNPSGTVTTHSVTIGKTLLNNGTINFSSNGNAAAAGIIFNSTMDGAFSMGPASVTNLRGVTMNKGTTQTPLITFTPNGAITVAGSTTTGFLVPGTGGTFELAGTNAFSNPVFAVPSYSINAACGFRMNNPNATVTGQGGSPTSAGLLRISQGTFNIGNATGISMGFLAGSRIIVEGGAVNAAGRFGVAAATNIITYTQTGGIVTVSTIGHTSTTLAGFDMGTSTFSTISITGGTIVVQKASTAASGPRDYRQQAGIGISSITGGATLEMGNVLSGTTQAFNIMGITPALIVTNISAGHTVTFGTPVTYNNSSRNITIQTGTTLDIGANIFLMSGTTLTNNGLLNGATAGARLYWFGTGAAQTYTGVGIVTPLLQSFELDNSLGVTIHSGVANIEAARIIMFNGNLTNANKITLGNGGTSSGTIQFGNATTPTPAGNLDVPPTFNLGTGGLNVSYLRETNPRTTGFEINPTRTLNNLTFDNNINATTIAGGAISVSGTLTLTNGRVNTTSANLLTVTNTAVASVTGSNANSYINGPFQRTLPASLFGSSTYIFPVGKSLYAPFELVNTTTNAGGNTLIRAETFDANSGGTPGTGISALNTNRYWASSFTSGGANFTDGIVRVTEPVLPLAGGNRLAQSATVNGAYNSIGNTISGATIASTAPVTTLGFFNTGLTDLLLTAGVYTVGNTAPTYQKLTQVAADLSSRAVTGDIVFELLPDYDGTTGEAFPINFVPVTKSGGNWKVTIRPQTGVTGRVTSGDPGSGNPLVIFNNADSITLDGRPGGTGTTSEWVFRNIRTVITIGSVFVFQNGATADTLQYLKIEGQNVAATQASVLFGTSNTASGNSNNVLLGNDIRDRTDAPGVPHTLVASAGTAGLPNNNNKLIANTLRNFTANGIAVSANSNNWTVGGTTPAEGNNIFQQAQRTTATSHINFTTGDNHLVGYNNIYQPAGAPNTAGINCINITGSGNGHIIRNNSIGGSNASRTGASMVINAGSTINGILVTAGTTTSTQVYGNTISNFGNILTTGSSGAANGILVSGGTVNVGGLGANTIGGAVITGIASDTLVTGYDNGWINVSAGTVTIENNLVTNGSYYRMANDRNAGITINGGTNNIVRNNTIRALKGNNQVALPSAFTLAGIYIATPGTTLEGNTIDDIQNFNTTFSGPSALGINWAAGTGSILRNRITNVYATGAQAAAAAPLAYGMYISAGNPVISNNQVAMGANSSGEVKVAGIVSAANPGALISYNSVYINGANSAGANNSYGLLRTGASNNTYFNNILYNERAGGTGRHYAIGNTNAAPATGFTGVSANYNLYITSDATSVGEWGVGVNRDFGQWKTSSLADTSSYSATSVTVTAANLFTDAATGNLNINTANAESWYANGKAIAGSASGNIATDFAGDVRGTTLGNPTDIGADEFSTASSPPMAVASAAPALSTTTTYSFGGRKLGEITWGSVGTVPSSVDFRYYSSEPPPGFPNSSRFNMYYEITVPDGSGYTYDIKAYYTNAEKQQLTDAVLGLFKQNGISTNPWTTINGSPSIDADGKFIAVTGQTLNSFSRFTGAVANVLPVTLLSLGGEKQGIRNLLRWTTVHEQNNRGFEVQRSYDGTNYSVIGFVETLAAGGNSNSILEYKYADNAPAGLKQWYRLRMIDISGQAKFSNVTLLKGQAPATVTIDGLFPNPASTFVNVLIGSPNKDKVTLVVTDIAGRNLIQQVVNVETGNNTIPVDISRLTNGTYMVKLVCSLTCEIAVGKFVKQ